MGSYQYSSWDCRLILNSIISSYNISDVNFMKQLCGEVDDIVARGKYSQPMMWIGLYIAVASFFCVVAMTADLVHGFRKRKIWYPCNYFSLNATSITMIAVAMKLPVDLSSPMPGVVDQASKLGSMAFMCIMMANLMPSLASMGNKSLVANVTGLTIFVITMIVNICIEINTGVIDHENNIDSSQGISSVKYRFVKVAYTYLAMILLLLIILISSAVSIPTFKQILELKYQGARRTIINDQHNQHTTHEKLEQYLRRHWIMVKTSSPQFVMANNPLSFASGIICVITILTNISLNLEILHSEVYVAFKSDYKLSILAICVTQFIGVIVGGITPIFRCFTILSFKLFTKSNGKNLVDFKVEKYWTQKLNEWKETQIPVLSCGRRSRSVVHKLKALILCLCIGVQKIIVVSCKMARLIPVIVLIFVVYCLYCWNSLESMSGTTLATSKTNDTIEEDLDTYVMQLEDEIRLTDKTLEGISKSMDRLIEKAEKEKHTDLLKLLDKSTGFKGVANFSIDQVQPLLSVDLRGSWSLPIITLTCIAIALPNIPRDIANSLFKSVGEGILYTHLVEESLNTATEYVNIQKATMSLWHDIEYNSKWLDTTLTKIAFTGKTSEEILTWFADKSRKIVIETKSSTNDEVLGNFSTKLIAANSMYHISQTLLFNCERNIKDVTTKELFSLVFEMIADIMVACFTNIPRVITLKCDESVIEKREISVEAAAMLFGRTKKIVNRLEARKLPNMDLDQMAFVDEWCLHLKRSIP